MPSFSKARSLCEAALEQGKVRRAVIEQRKVQRAVVWGCRLAEVREAAGASAGDAALARMLASGDFDAAEYDRAMNAAFGEDYYEVPLISRRCSPWFVYRHKIWAVGALRHVLVMQEGTPCFGDVW